MECLPLSRDGDVDSPNVQYDHQLYEIATVVQYYYGMIEFSFLQFIVTVEQLLGLNYLRLLSPTKTPRTKSTTLGSTVLMSTR